MARMGDHDLLISISKTHQGIEIKTLNGNNIKRLQTTLCTDTVTFAAGDLCITAVRA